jgi:hypothetical protein
MNKHLGVVVLLAACSAAAGAFAADACSVELCMAGMVLTGNQPDKCSGPIKDFFAIIKFKNGSPSPSRTLKARQSLLNNCPSGNTKEKSAILEKFGSVFV